MYIVTVLPYSKVSMKFKNTFLISLFLKLTTMSNRGQTKRTIIPIVFLLTLLQFVDSIPQNNYTEESALLSKCHLAFKRSKWVKLATTCSTGLALAPATCLAYEHNLTPSTINLAGSLASSMMYHCADSLKVPILGVHRLKWHQLDNIFSISAVGSLFIHVTCGPSEAYYLANLVNFLFNAYLQIRDPWNLR
jgi:hypothetical protein